MRMLETIIIATNVTFNQIILVLMKDTGWEKTKLLKIILFLFFRSIYVFKSPCILISNRKLFVRRFENRPAVVAKW
jgi:hypothetical protein